MNSEKQILDKKQKGDLVVVAEMLTRKLGKKISPQNAGKLIIRGGAKNHAAAIDCLRKVVENRELLINEIK